ncbi:CHASE3 domain-containing protein [Nocardia asiatica]|uniref:CHASE3 domain-containing protein n=1 Tax=Nocardia asiatica TaxID=209252 RepID=UPI0002F6944F|nr:hypothetical protein [Nocardia asiatica]
MEHRSPLDTQLLQLVADVEPAMAAETVLAAARTAASIRAKQLRIVQALTERPDLLTCGRPDGPVAVDHFIHALIAAGAAHVVAPRCPDCEKPNKLSERADNTRICLPCKQKRKRPKAECANCKAFRWLQYHDRQGRRVCRDCRPGRDVDAVALLAAQLRELEPEMDRDIMNAAITKVSKLPNHLLKLSWEIEDRPGLLTGEAASGSPFLIRLITELRRAGARHVVLPPCPVCNQDLALTNRLDGQRVCNPCYKKAEPKKTCTRCGRERLVVGRTSEGKPLCQYCHRNVGLLHEECTTCHRHRFIVQRHGTEQLCNICYRLPLALCGRCGHYRNCLGVAAGHPVCESCSHKKWPCVRCGKTLQIAARGPDGRLCHTCYEKDPISFRTCTECGTVDRLYHYGLCPRCALARQLDQLFRGPDAVDRPELDALHQVLLNATSPNQILQWLSRSASAQLLSDIAAGTCPLTHEEFDRRLSRNASRHLRGILATAGILKPRDEYLADLQAWIDKALTTVDNPEQRKLLRRFVTWHHLSRLRRLLGDDKFAQRAQVDAIRVSLRAAIALLRWLDEQDLTLASCQQADIDRWITEGSSTRYQARGFVQWSVQKHHAHQIEIPEYRKTKQTVPLDAERRWALARQLLNNRTIHIGDRVAGLFTLLYAQSVTNIVRLTMTDVTVTTTETHINFGPKPLNLPPELAQLLHEHIKTRSARSVVNRAGESPWLFPGVDPARHLSPNHLGHRLKKIGIFSRPGRHAALLDFATQMPAAVFADLLGVSPSAADRWVDRSGASWAKYAAVVQRRAPQ